MGTPVERLEAWMEWAGIPSQEALAKRIECTQGLVSKILRGGTLPGRLVANAIERESASWPDGPIRSEEWDVVELARGAAASTESKPAA